jgi:hypothetical protein
MVFPNDPCHFSINTSLPSDQDLWHLFKDFVITKISTSRKLGIFDSPIALKQGKETRHSSEKIMQERISWRSSHLGRSCVNYLIVRKRPEFEGCIFTLYAAPLWSILNHKNLSEDSQISTVNIIYCSPDMFRHSNMSSSWVFIQ